jgi:2'-5' RNA ligase
MISGHQESALLIPISGLDQFVDRWRLELDPARQRAIPTHVTVLYPFVPPDALTTEIIEQLRNLFVDVQVFPIKFSESKWFDETVLYLTPDPDSMFRQLTAMTVAAFPDYPPYEGRHPDLTPHLTLANSADKDRSRAAELDIVSHLPTATVADRAWLMTGPKVSGSWKIHTEFLFRRRD